VEVIGEVPDPRPFVWGSQVFVAPLRIAQGLQNKVLEAMAAETPVVSTPGAVRGIEGASSAHVRRAESDESFAGEVCALLEDRGAAEAQAARARVLVESHYSWERAAADFEKILSGAMEHGKNT
jgi:glycosyltransferase involved in cell wall biosynthesis